MKRPSDIIPHHDTPHQGGSFHRPEDGEREEALINFIKMLSNLDEVVQVGKLSYLDYIGIRDDCPIAWIELISRNYTWTQLERMGGIWLKRATYETAFELSHIPLSTLWRGAYIMWDLQDGLYWQEAARITYNEIKLNDPRNANRNDTGEDGINVTNPELWIPWT